jgi:hypothetical protein
MQVHGTHLYRPFKDLYRPSFKKCGVADWEEGTGKETGADKSELSSSMEEEGNNAGLFVMADTYCQDSRP